MKPEATQTEIDATYRAIGHFISEYSTLEEMLRLVIGFELRLRMDLFDVLLTHDFSLLCTAVLTIFKERVHDEAKFASLTKLVNKCRELNDLRVKVVHGEWRPAKEGGSVSHVSRRNLRRGELVGMKDLLEQKAEQARSIVHELDDFQQVHQQDEKAAKDLRKKRAAIGRLFG